MNSTMTPSVDLSSFPLLRIDQIHLHETQTLLQSQTELEKLQAENGMESIASFISKLLVCIRKEIADRSSNICKDSTKHPPQPTTPTSTKKSTTSRKPSWISNRSDANPTNTPSSKVVSFVASPKSSSNFRSRIKAAKESLRARSQPATMEQLEQKRAERTREVLDTMQAWRTEREKSKAQRDALFEEEERLRRKRRRERIEREKQVRDSMHAAAEEAKSKALESGCTEEEAFVEAAAAASRAADVVENSDCSLFNSSTVDSDDDSYLYDNVDEGNGVLPMAPVDDVATFEDTTAVVMGQIDEEDETRLTPTASPSVSASSASLHEDDDNANSCPVSKDMPRMEDTMPSPIESDLSIHNQQNINSALIDTNAAESLSDRDISPLADSIATLDIAYLPTDDVEQHTLTVKDHISDVSQVAVLPCDELQNVSQNVLDKTTSATPTACKTQECHDRPSPRNDEDEVPSTPKKSRQLCDLFPSFSSIFTKFQTKGKSHINDSTQKELISCMQHQIRLHEMYPLQLDDDSLESNIESRLFYRINSRRPEVRALLDEVFSHYALSEWNELPDHIDVSSWNLLWTWGQPKASEFDNLFVFQKINRFRRTKGLTRKDLLKKNMQRFGFGHLMPLTYALPHEYNAFVAGYTSIQKSSEQSSPNLWIVKPIGLSRGRGISVVKDISEVAYSQPIVIQKYISNPMLFLQYKFDLRIYVLVTSFQPLEAFIYKEGLARFGSRKYSNKPESLKDTRIHLTNTSLQKEFGDIADKSHPAYLAGNNGSGSKVALSWLWKRLDGQGVNTAEMWNKVIQVCGKALESVDADIPNQQNSFELFGFDVMFDTDEKCWLIEVNSSPSLSCDSPLDNRIKGGLIVDTISLVDPVAYDRSALADICKRRITHRKAGTLLEEDLQRILPNTIPRRNEEMTKLGKFERIV